MKQFIIRIFCSFRSTFRLLVVIAALICAIAPPFINSASAQTILYVDKTVSHNYPPNTPPGNSWSNAFKYLRDAIDLANSSATSTNRYHIWVAANTYKPNESSQLIPVCDGASHHRCYSFEMHEFVFWYGGFAGNGTSLDQRNPLANITILSGDIGTPDDYSDNSWHVVTANRVGDSDSARIDGFHIIRGNAIDAPSLLPALCVGI